MIAGTCWGGNTSDLGSHSQVMTSTGKCCWICSRFMFRENLPHMGSALQLRIFFVLHLHRMGPDGKNLSVAALSLAAPEAPIFVRLYYLMVAGFKNIFDDTPESRIFKFKKK
jgi:hypothetical protein